MQDDSTAAAVCPARADGSARARSLLPAIANTCGGGRTNVISSGSPISSAFVCLDPVRRAAIVKGVDGDAADPQLLGRAKDPHRNLTAICDEQLRDHDDMRVPRGAYESRRPGPASTAAIATAAAGRRRERRRPSDEVEREPQHRVYRY